MMTDSSHTQTCAAHQNDPRFAELIRIAHDSGASAAAVISTRKIVVDPLLADKCREPRRSNYGLSKSCPPHVSGPSGIEKVFEGFHQAVFFKIDVPSEMLYSSENREVFQLLHQAAAGIEKSAVGLGFENARAYAGGSCKNIFCYAHAECRALSQEKACRHPEHARPSMSGFGINVAELYKTAGWDMGSCGRQDGDTKDKLASVCALVLIC